MSKPQQKRQIGAMELLGIIGFSLFIAWLLSVYFWFFSLDALNEPYPQRSLVQGLLFLGLVLGYLAIRFLAPKHREIRAGRLWTIFIYIPTLFLPFLIILEISDVAVPPTVLWIALLLSGVSASFFIVSWLDICGRSRIKNYMIYTCVSFTGGAFLFILGVFLPQIMQSVTEAVYSTLSLILLFYIGSRASNNDGTIVRKRDALFSHPRELEVSIFIFGVLFGASAVMLCQFGQDFTLYGLLMVLLMSIAISATLFLQPKFDLLTLMRIFTCIALAGVLLLPFIGELGIRVLLILNMGLWAAFTAENYASLTRMVISRNLSIFYHISTGLSVSAAGFFLGWMVPAVLMFQNFATSQFILPLLSIVIFALVAAEMFFYPARQHHDTFAQEMDPAQAPSIPEALAGYSGDEIMRIKSDAVVKHYGLSPREIEIFDYLIKGRNADYICTKLIISSHTVKSHIYNIYHKLNIHSQQKLINFVEEYPIDVQGR